MFHQPNEGLIMKSKVTHEYKILNLKGNMLDKTGIERWSKIYSMHLHIWDILSSFLSELFEAKLGNRNFKGVLMGDV